MSECTVVLTYSQICHYYCVFDNLVKTVFIQGVLPPGAIVTCSADNTIRVWDIGALDGNTNNNITATTSMSTSTLDTTATLDGAAETHKWFNLYRCVSTEYIQHVATCKDYKLSISCNLLGVYILYAHSYQHACVCCVHCVWLSLISNSKYMLRVLYVNAESDGTCDEKQQQQQQQQTSTAIEDSSNYMECSLDQSKVLHDIEVPITHSWPTAPRSLAIHPNGLQVCITHA
jgi:hypothetical protein